MMPKDVEDASLAYREALEDIAMLTKALQDIIKHQQIIGGPTVRTSAEIIAQRALDSLGDFDPDP